MAEQKIKFKVSIKELSFEFEGSREVGQALQAGLSRSLGGLVDAQRIAMAAIPAKPGTPPVDETGNGFNGIHVPAEQVVNGQPPADKPKKARKSGGTSLTNLLRDLKKETYFSEPRSPDAVRERLKLKGHTFPENTIASRLLDLTKKDELFRQQSDTGYMYKDTPFDEVPRTAGANPEPAE